METGQKRKYIKPQIKFVTDFNIVLECLHEVYGLEKNIYKRVEIFIKQWHFRF